MMWLVTLYVVMWFLTAVIGGWRGWFEYEHRYGGASPQLLFLPLIWPISLPAKAVWNLIGYLQRKYPVPQ